MTWRNSSRGRSGIEESPPTVPEVSGGPGG